MNQADILENFKKETNTTLSIAQVALVLRESMKGVSDEKIEQYKAEKPLTDEGKKEAISVIGEKLREAEVNIESILPTEVIDSQVSKLVENNNDLQDKDSLKNSKKTQLQTTVDSPVSTPSPTNDEICTFVIPVIADKIITNGKDGVEKNTVSYDSDNFTAMLRLGDEEQTISLDRKDATSPDDTRALLASKGNNQQEYQIIINNVKAEEFEKFKALFDKATQKNDVNKAKEQPPSRGSEID